jgi:hypothetical protein
MIQIKIVSLTLTTIIKPFNVKACESILVVVLEASGFESGS